MVISTQIEKKLPFHGRETSSLNERGEADIVGIIPVTIVPILKIIRRWNKSVRSGR